MHVDIHLRLGGVRIVRELISNDQYEQVGMRGFYTCNILSIRLEECSGPAPSKP